MKKNGTIMTVSSVNGSTCIKISGRANCNASVNFKKFAHQFLQTGSKRLILDLSDCLLMDSTFLGVLAGMMREMPKCSTEQEGPCLELLNPSDRITDLLDSLGLLEFFQVRRGSLPGHQEIIEIHVSSPKPDPKTVCQTSLDAHDELIRINPENAAKFQGVRDLLAHELKQNSPKKS